MAAFAEEADAEGKASSADAALLASPRWGRACTVICAAKVAKGQAPRGVHLTRITAVFGVAVLAVGAAGLCAREALLPPPGAEGAAVDGLLVRYPGSSPDSSGGSREGNCAIIQFDVSGTVEKVSVRYVGNSWEFVKIATDAEYFDLDDPRWETSCRTEQASTP